MSNYKPLVSIIIPVYNGANYMQEAIDSALNQTYHNIETIVVNDGSDDQGATDALAKSYGDQIRYFVKENGGVASALNLAIDKMKGKYFSWLSHDDVYNSNKIECQINTLSHLSDKNTILYSPYELINKKSEFITIVDPSTFLSNEQLNTPLLPLFRGVINGCTLLIPRELFYNVGKFDESLKTTQDYRLWFDFLNQAKIHFCDMPLTKTRVHEEQGSKTILIANEECNNLWIELLDTISEEKMIETEGSCYAFLRRAELFLKSSPYKEAASYAEDKARKYYGTSLVSVILPVYDRIDLAIKSIDSVLNQTYSNIEIIIVNDGSREDVSSLEKLVQSNDKIKYFVQENKGAASARNKGIKNAQGDYIAFLDSDDYFAPQKIELQLRKMIDDDCYISHTAYSRVDKEGTTIQVMNNSDLQGYVFDKILRPFNIATPTVLLRKNLLHQNKFAEDLRVGEDVCLWIDLLYDRKLSYLNESCVSVLFDEYSTVNNTEQYFVGLINIINHIVQTVPYERYKSSLGHLITATLTLLPSAPIKRENGRALNMLRKTYSSLKMYGLKHTVKRILRVLGF